MKLSAWNLIYIQYIIGEYYALSQSLAAEAIDGSVPECKGSGGPVH